MKPFTKKSRKLKVNSSIFALTIYILKQNAIKKINQFPTLDHK